MVVQATTFVLGDEFSMGLYEINLQSSNGWRRYQLIHVIRDDKIAEHWTDLGSARKFKGVEQVLIPSFMVHTVNELREMADEMRGNPPYDKRELVGVDRIKS